MASIIGRNMPREPLEDKLRRIAKAKKRIREREEAGLPSQVDPRCGHEVVPMNEAAAKNQEQYGTSCPCNDRRIGCVVGP